jgi:2-polyprenyl-6-methoxyphenol hydroxylase-like FAD-dependent oxidoreductase
MEVWDGDSSGRIHFSADALHENCLGYIVENRVILAALHERLAQHENVALISGVTPQQVSPPAADGARELLLSDGRHLVTRLLVGADGAESPTRRPESAPPPGIMVTTPSSPACAVNSPTPTPAGSALPRMARWHCCRWRSRVIAPCRWFGRHHPTMRPA